MKFKGLSLFANVGVAEALLDGSIFNIVLANEIHEKRAQFYSEIYTNTEMVIGDITDDHIRNLTITKAKEKNIEFVIATPPCQGMSEAGKREPYDERNQLVYYAIDIIKRINPKFVMLENVPMQMKTKIKVDNEFIKIPDYIHHVLSHNYNFNSNSLIKAMDHGVPQMRERSIFLMTRKDLGISWDFPDKQEPITLRDAFKDIPSLDPYLREGIDFTLLKFPNFLQKKEKGRMISKWHFPPTHSWKSVEWMIHTPTGKSAMFNDIFYPQKKNGDKVKGHHNHYRRLYWDKPSRTITQNNGVISSLACVHPGYRIYDAGNDVSREYSDPRVLSIYELLIVMSLPTDWPIPSWAEERFIRKVLGEGIPPKLVRNIIDKLEKELESV